MLVPRSSWSGKRSPRCGRRRPSGLGGTWNGFEMPTLPTKKCEREDQNSALHNANVDTDRKEANDVWSAPEVLRVRSGYDVWACVEVEENSEKTEVEACRKALGLAKDAREYEDRRTVLTRWVVYLGGVYLGVEETSNIQE